MGNILSKEQSDRIKELNREFREKFPDWMCEGSEYFSEVTRKYVPCNIIFDNGDRFFKATYDGKVIDSENMGSVNDEEIKEMAMIQGKIRFIAEGWNEEEIDNIWMTKEDMDLETR